MSEDAGKPILTGDAAAAAAQLPAPPRGDVARHTFRSGMVALMVRVGQSLLLLTSALVLARLLTPEDFGVFAMVVPLVLIVNSQSNQGFQTTLLQSQTLGPNETSAFYGFAIRANAGLIALLVAGSALLSWFYHEQRVLPLAAIWGAALFLLTRTSFQEALLKRDMRFPTVLGIQLGALAVGILSAIVAALLGARYWALLVQVLITELTRALCIDFVSRWRPRRIAVAARDGRPDASLRSFWFSLAGFRLANWLAEQPDRLLVGRLGGALTLGLYDSARRWAWYPFSEPFLSLSDVAVASLSAVSLDAQRYRRFLSRQVRAILTIALPPIAFTAVESDNVIHVLLGPQWDASAPFLRIVSIAAFVGSLGQLPQWVYISLGNAGRMLRWSLMVQIPVRVLAVLVGATAGASGIAIGYTAATVLLAAPTLAYSLHGTPIKTRDVLRAALRPALAAVVGALVLIALRGALPNAEGLARLAGTLALYLPTVTLVWIALPGGRAAASELIAALKELRKPMAS